ncbi:hypothetical protein [Alkalinema sp. FACHB-956]|uniref:hypothetical protein n=1 Tax=Alkalinema sp. FACHB-956 TaxID=2692768 RepID=UPI001F54B929|nr:hypothetical protein [Alkalinema sp. FACHB-956]
MISCLSGCSTSQQSPPLAEIKLYQNWELQAGDRVGGYEVTGGLGDISIALKGQSIYAPFNGDTQLDKRRCVYFDSPEVPSYKLRFCGVQSPKVGKVQQGEAIGRGETLQFAALRRQPNGTWAIVEPSKIMLEKTLKAP